MKLLVTGSSGTIGTRLCELLREQHDIVGVDKRPNKWSPVVNEFTRIADLTAPAELPAADTLIHLGANARVYDLVKTPQMAMDNFQTTFRMLEHARKNDIKRFIFASSREVYGNSDKLVHKEEDALVQNCESPYTASKIGGEALVHSYGECYGIDFVILRFSNVYGMYDDSDRVIPLFIRQTAADQDLVVYGKDKLLDFTYIDDCVDGIRRVIEGFDTVKNDTFNIASGKGTAISKIAEMIISLMEGKNNVRIEPSRTGEVIKYVADISKISERTGYQPTVPVEEGIKRAIDWWRQTAT